MLGKVIQNGTFAFLSFLRANQRSGYYNNKVRDLAWISWFCSSLLFEDKDSKSKLREKCVLVGNSA